MRSQVNQDQLMKHLEKEIARVFLLLMRKITKTSQSTPPTSSRQSSSIKPKSGLIKNIMSALKPNNKKEKPMPVKRPPLSDDPDQNIVPDEPIVEEKPDIVMTSRKARAADPTLAPVAAVAPPPPPPPPSSSSMGSSFGGFSGGSSSFSSSSAQSRPMNEQEFQLAKMQMEMDNEKQNDNWVKAYWRPAMGWLYMIICFMDFVGFPLIHIFLPVIGNIFGVPMGYVPWKSLTLENGGLVHMAFGAILGVAAWTRGQEKLQGKA